MSDTNNAQNHDEQLDLGDIVTGLVNMKTELEGMKQSIAEDMKKSNVLKKELKEEYQALLQKQSMTLEELIQLIGELTSQKREQDNIPEPDHVDPSKLTLEQQHYISTLNTLVTRVFEGIGDVRARLEAMEGDFRDLDNRVILQNERIQNLDQTIRSSMESFEKNSTRWFELAKFQMKVVMVSLGVVGAAVGIKELFDFLPQIFGF